LRKQKVWESPAFGTKARSVEDAGNVSVIPATFGVNETTEALAQRITSDALTVTEVSAVELETKLLLTVPPEKET
jgi:hypothetical protein